MSERDKTREAGGAQAGLELFHPAVREWFEAVFRRPRARSRMGWPAIARGESTLILAPTGTRQNSGGVFVVHRPADVQRPCRRTRSAAASSTFRRSKRWRWTWSATCARRWWVSRRRRSRLGRRHSTSLRFAIRTGDTPQRERARFARHPADILITTPESLYLLLTSNARETPAFGRDGDRR